MTAHIETACFNYSGGCEMIFASNKEAEWIRKTTDIRECYGKLFDKESGSSILMIFPANDGVILTISKMIPNRFGDNLTAYLRIPNALDISGETLQGIVLDVISSLAHNRRDAVCSCLSSISSTEYEQLTHLDFELITTNRCAYRRVNSDSSINSLSNVLNNLFQDYYWQYKYIFLAIDNQHVANHEQYNDLTDYPLTDWRPVQDKVIEQKSDVDYDSYIEDDKKNIETVQPENQSVEITSEWLKENTQIHGWLSFFFFAIFTGGLISCILPIATFKKEDYFGSYILGSVDLVMGVLLLGIAVFTIYSFHQRKPNAIFWARTYIIIVIITNLIGLFSGETSETGFQSTPYLIRAVIFGIIWLLYLAFSNQVKEVIPKSFRKVSKTDKSILAGIIGIPILLLLLGVGQIFFTAKDREIRETELKNLQLAYNERTDGKVIFKIPENFTCERQDVTIEGVNITIYNINNDDIGSCTICSDYETDKSQSNFDSYWKNWEDDEAVKYISYDVDHGNCKINGNYCRYRITKYDVNGVYVYWRYYLMFNDATGKIVIASFYDADVASDYVNELLYSVRFEK